MAIHRVFTAPYFPLPLGRIAHENMCTLQPHQCLSLVPDFCSDPLRRTQVVPPDHRPACSSIASEDKHEEPPDSALLPSPSSHQCPSVASMRGCTACSMTHAMWRMAVSSLTGATAPPQNAGGAVLQLAGSAPILVPRSAKLFIVSLMNTPGTGGVHSPGIDTIRTWTSAWRLSREISAIAYRCRSAVAVAARVEVSRLRWTTAGQFGAVTSGTGRN